MKNKACILLLSAALCVPFTVSPAMAACVFAESASNVSTDSVEETEPQANASEDSLDEESATQETDNAESTETERTKDTFMDVEERKALDEQAAAAASGFEPMADPAETASTENEQDDATDEVDTSELSEDALGAEVIATNENTISFQAYLSYVKQMEDAKDGEDVILSIPYQDGSLLLDVDTLSGMTDYRGAFTVNVTDEDGNTRYRLGFPESVWKEEEPIDLSASIESSGKEQTLTFQTKQEFPFMVSVSFPAIKAEHRYLLSDADGSEYGLSYSADDKMLTFQVAALKDYVIKDASSHKYDSMDPTITDAETPAGWIQRNKTIFAAIVVAAVMVALAFLIPVKKR